VSHTPSIPDDPVVKVCNMCNVELAPDSTLLTCDSCRATSKRRYERRKSEGLCTSCGKPCESLGKIICNSCRDKALEKHEELEENRRQAKVCRICGLDKPAPRSKMCSNCSKKYVGYGEQRRITLSVAGKCTSCSGELGDFSEIQNSKKSKVCRQCFLRRLAGTYLKNPDLGFKLERKLMDQEYKCPYSGKILVLGVNASIDHIYPQSRFPDKKYDLSNLEWVDLYINLLKRDMTKDEFISLIRNIHSNLSAHESKLVCEGSALSF